MADHMEIHQIISAPDASSLLKAEKEFISQYPDYEVSVKRYFLSSREQKEQLEKTDDIVSYVIQPVLGEDNIAVWLMLTKDCPVELIWRTNLHSADGDSEEQTRSILVGYESDLRQSGLCIADDCVRTWFYVDDIDNEYAGMVKARRENFEKEGMTRDTHYLASTGIYGKAVAPGSTVQMDALAIRGEFSQRYLYAPECFNPTHEYGVTFERGVVLSYGNEQHTLISGTASINNKGEIVHPADVKAQAQRMIDNVKALLDEAGNNWTDVNMIVVYLRNAEDYKKVSPIFSEKFGGKTPYIITHAPVCRPGWLIEMECIAVKEL